ncbi:MAG: universal stress protein [SAR202 cluster bacterium]|nr:universal stress protein [SAR202 cluster bacterium]
MYNSIVVPLDGSQVARQALPYAVMVSQATGASLLLLAVVEQAEPPRVATSTKTAGRHSAPSCSPISSISPASPPGWATTRPCACRESTTS